MSRSVDIALADLPALALAERRDLPDAAAIYFVLAGDTVLYIGQSVSLRQRWLAHHRLTQLNAYGGCKIAWMQVDDAALLDELEDACIAHFQPLLNGQEKLGGGTFAERRLVQISVGFTPDTMEELRSLAREKGLQPATLLRVWTIERMRQERPGWVPEAPAEREP